jgi:DNA repair photolyase
MSIIYPTSGATVDDAAMAANLYNGCSHACTYCYAPACRRMKREVFNQPTLRPNVLDNIAKDVKKTSKGESRRVLFCFTTDCYQPIESEHHITRQAIKLLHGVQKIRVLTKDPARALAEDGDLLMAEDVQLGATISCLDDRIREKYEPGAPSIESRIRAIEQASKAGLYTWLSIEPVLEMDGCLQVLKRLTGVATEIRVGRWNHSQECVDWDWGKFTKEALAILKGTRYIIKIALWKSAGLSNTIGYPRISGLDQTTIGQ